MAQAIFSLARAGRHEQEHESGWILKKKNKVLTQLKCSGDLEILTRGGAGGSGALTPGKLHWFLFGRFLDICLAVYGLIVSGIESESNVNFWPGWLQIYQWH